MKGMEFVRGFLKRSFFGQVLIGFAIGTVGLMLFQPGEAHMLAHHLASAVHRHA